MDNHQAPSEHPSLGQFMQALLTNPPSELRAVMSAEAVRLYAQSQPREAGTTTLGLLNAAAAREKSRINSSNRVGKDGREPKEDWVLRCGMDPVDALLIPTLLAQLGAAIPLAAYDKLLAAHAIEGGGAALAKTPLERRLKSLRQEPKTKIKRALQERTARLSEDASVSRSQLIEIARRVWPDGPSWQDNG